MNNMFYALLCLHARSAAWYTSSTHNMIIVLLFNGIRVYNRGRRYRVGIPSTSFVFSEFRRETIGDTRVVIKRIFDKFVSDIIDARGIRASDY